MGAVQACRQGGGVVRDNEIAGTQNIDELLARDVAQAVASVDDEQLGGSHAACGLPFVASVFSDRIQQLARGGVGTLQGRAIRVGHRERVQRRVHVARIDRQEPHSLFGNLRIPDVRQMAQRRFARAVGAPRGIRIDGRVARHVQHDRSAPLARRCRERAEQRLRQAKRTEDVRRECALEILALGVAEQRQRRRTEIRRVVDEDVEAAQLAENLQRHRVDVVFRRDVAHDAVRARMLAGDLVDPLAMARDERDAGALLVQKMDEGKAEARRAAGDRDADVGERMGSHF